jgi:hypothetical protein
MENFYRINYSIFFLSQLILFLFLTPTNNLFAQNNISTIEITPSNPTMNVGSTQTFVAQGFDQDGNLITINDPHWETDSNFGNFVVNPQDPNQCIFTAIAAGIGYILCYEGPPGQATVHGSTDITITDGGQQLTTIEITPSNPTMNVGDTQTFVAQGLDQNGNPMTIAGPNWETDTNFGDYVVNPDDPAECTFTATAEGNSYISCYEGPPGQATVHGSTDISITDGSQQLTTIEITPSNATMNVGDTQTFIALGLDQNGNQMTITPQWSTTGGTINASGEYTATTEGIFTVTASAERDSVVGFTSVTVNKTGINENANPAEPKLYPNYPNPFVSETIIQFHLKTNGHVKLKITDAWGHEISVLADSHFIPGTHEVIFNSKGLAPGIYYYSISTTDFYDIKKMVVLK